MAGPAADPEPAERPVARSPRRPGAAGPAHRAPLLVVCALGVERYALRRGAPGPAGGPVALLRTGMGPRAARDAVTGALRGDPALRTASVLATGLCAGVAEGIRPGDVVVDDRGTAPGVLAAALGDLGATVHTGRIAGSDRVVRGAGRAALRATGALAVDMETAAVRQAVLDAGPRPFAAVRVVVDTPEHELLRAGTLRHGITALRVLSSVFPAFTDWHHCVALSRR